MDGHHFLPVREGKVDNRLYNLNAGIAYQDVDPTILSDSTFDSLIDGCLISNIHRHCECIASICFQRPRCRRGGLKIQIRDDWYATSSGNANCDSPSNPTGSTGNNCYLTIKPHGR
jgi:hypothetical protein